MYLMYFCYALLLLTSWYILSFRIKLLCCIRHYYPIAMSSIQFAFGKRVHLSLQSHDVLVLVPKHP